MKENRNLSVKNAKNADVNTKNEILLQLPIQMYGSQNTKVHMRPSSNNNNNNNNTKDDSQKSLFRLSSTIVECYCRIELKFVW